MKIEIKGLDEALRNIQKYGERVQADTKKEVASAALAIEGGAVARSPVDQGNLKNSNGIRFINDGYGAEVFNSAEYAVHVEFGTHKMAAQPFLNPSYEHNYPQFINNIKKVLQL